VTLNQYFHTPSLAPRGSYSAAGGMNSIKIEYKKILDDSYLTKIHIHLLHFKIKMPICLANLRLFCAKSPAIGRFYAFKILWSAFFRITGSQLVRRNVSFAQLLSCLVASLLVVSFVTDYESKRRN